MSFIRKEAQKSIQSLSPRMWSTLLAFLKAPKFTIPRRPALDNYQAKTLNALIQRGLLSWEGDWYRHVSYYDTADDREYRLTISGVETAQAYLVGTKAKG